MKKLMIFFVLSLVLLTAACSNNDQNQEKGATDSKQSLTFGLMPAIDSIPFIIASEKGFFEEYGIEVNLVPFSSPSDRDAAFQAGNLDGVIADFIAIGLYNDGGFDVQIAGTTTGNFTLLTTPSITSIEDLEGQDVIIARNTAIEYTLDMMLDSVGMSPDSVNKQQVPEIPARLELLRNDQAAAAVLPEPFATIGANDGLVRLANTVGMNINPFVIAFTQEAIDTKAEEIRAFSKAYNAAVDFLNEADVEEFIDIVIEQVRFPAELRDQIELPVFRHNRLPEEADVQTALDWLRDREVITGDFGPSDVISDVAFR